MAYEYDIFLSYPREGAVGIWVREVFHPYLKDRYPDECKQRHGGIFFDDDMERGGDLPERLKTALSRSAVMVAVWSPRYFASDWCTAEWKSMLAREQSFRLGEDTNPALLLPVVFGDGDDYPLEARNTTQERCFKKHAHLGADAPGDVAFNAFRRDVAELCSDLGRWVKEAPDWEDDFPIALPDSIPLPKWRNPSSL